MTKKEFERLFNNCDIEFLSIAHRFLYDKNFNPEIMKRICELRHYNCAEDLYKIRILVLYVVLAELIREHDDK